MNFVEFGYIWILNVLDMNDCIEIDGKKGILEYQFSSLLLFFDDADLN